MAKAIKNKETIKGGNKERFRMLKNIKEKIQFPYLLLFAIVAIIIALFILGIKIPFGDEGTSSIINNRVTKFLNLYYGIVNITINNKTLENEVWKVNVNGYSADGIVNFDILVNAKDFSIIKISQNLVIPSEPSTIMKTGKEVGCSVGELKTVDLYIDPYDPWSIKYDSEIEKFNEKFKDSIRLNYRIVSTYTYTYISENASSPVYMALLYYECAKDKEYFKKFKSCVINKYNEKKSFLDEVELLDCIETAGGDKEYISSCAESNYPKQELGTDQSFAKTFLGREISPMFVVDCKYYIYPLYMENAFCHLYPNTLQCKEDRE